MIVIHNLLTKEECKEMVEALDDHEWHKGENLKVKNHKHNKEIFYGESETISKFLDKIGNRLLKDETIKQYGQICRITEPRFNKYTGEDTEFYNRHTDSVFQGDNIRTDWSFTVFLTEPDTYEGGELVLETTDQMSQVVKLPAGSIVFYPSGLLHTVKPVTTGGRVAVIGWAESYIRDPFKRELIGRFARNLEEIRASMGVEGPYIELMSICTNLQKMWVEK